MTHPTAMPWCAISLRHVRARARVSTPTCNGSGSTGVGWAVRREWGHVVTTVLGRGISCRHGVVDNSRPRASVPTSDGRAAQSMLPIAR